VRADGNWEGHTILNRSKRMLLGGAEHEEPLARARGVLLAARETRVRPGRDDKVLADWNGMISRALAARGFAIRARPDWIARGAAALAGIMRLLVGPPLRHIGGRLSHSYRQGVRGAPAML